MPKYQRRYRKPAYAPRSRKAVLYRQPMVVKPDGLVKEKITVMVDVKVSAAGTGFINIHHCALNGAGSTDHNSFLDESNLQWQ